MGRKITLFFFTVMSYFRRNNKTSKRVTRADSGIIEVMFVAIGRLLGAFPGK